MRFLLVLIAVCTLGSTAPPAWADGGALRLSEQSGRYRISLFTQPTPCRVGPIDLSVLVQDAVTGTAVTDAAVMVQMEPSTGPRRTLRAVATTSAATNKLLQAVVLDVPTAGCWHGVVLVVHDGVQLSNAFDIDVDSDVPPWRSFGLWIAAPFVVIVLFVVHQVLKARRF
jgi:hypothetical protein